MNASVQANIFFFYSYLRFGGPRNNMDFVVKSGKVYLDLIHTQIDLRLHIEYKGCIKSLKGAE